MVLALVTLLCACCAPSALPVYIGADAPEDVVCAVDEAVEYWNDRVGVEALELRMVASEREAFRDPFSVRVEVADYVSEDSAAYADAHLVENRVRVERSIVEDRGANAARRAVAHELGHVLGLGHVGEPGNLMAVEVEGEGTALTPAQRRRVRALLALRAAAWPVHP